MNRTTVNRNWARLAVIGVALVGACAPILGRLRADDEKAAQAAEKPDLAKALIGTWTLSETKGPAGNPSGIGTRLRFFTGTHWMITQPDPKTGEVVFHHGGRYTLDGENMAETVDFANASTLALVGQSHKFKIKVDGDTYNQVGQDNPWTETWKRVK